MLFAEVILDEGFVEDTSVVTVGSMVLEDGICRGGLVDVLVLGLCA